MPNADKLSVSSRTGAATVGPLSWWLSLLVVTALAGHALLTLAAAKRPVMAPVIRQTSSIDCGLAALAMLLRDKASITTSVTALDNLATVLIDPTTSRHRREGYSVSELQTLTAAFTHSLRARNLTLEEFYTRSFPLIAWIDSAQGGISRWWRERPQRRYRWQTPLVGVYLLPLISGANFGLRKRQALSLSWNDRFR
jgi:hypothetical protein